MYAIWADPGSIPVTGFLREYLFLATAMRKLEWALTIVIYVSVLQIKKSGKRPLNLKEKKLRKMYCSPPCFCS